MHCSKRTCFISVPVSRHVVLAVSLAAVLCGCGKSGDQKHEDMVRCGGFEGGLAIYSMNAGLPQGMPSVFGSSAQQGMSANAQAFATSLRPVLEKNNISALSPAIPVDAVKQYSETMDPARVSRLEEDGLNTLKGFADKNDPDGAMSFYNSCISEYRDMGK